MEELYDMWITSQWNISHPPSSCQCQTVLWSLKAALTMSKPLSSAPDKKFPPFLNFLAMPHSLWDLSSPTRMKFPHAQQWEIAESITTGAGYSWEVLYLLAQGYSWSASVSIKYSLMPVEHSNRLENVWGPGNQMGWAPTYKSEILVFKNIELNIYTTSNCSVNCHPSNSLSCKPA